jgi:hypothetical protein
MSEQPEWYERWYQTHEAMVACVCERRFEEAAQIMERAREEAVGRSSFEEAASYSHFLSSCLSVLHKDQEALAAAEKAESLAPGEPQYALHSASLLINNLDNPRAALEKVSALLNRLDPESGYRHHALSLYGQAHLALGIPEVAIASFREMIAPAMIERVRAGEYWGSYDLGLVRALVEHRLLRDECGRYLREVIASAKARGDDHAVEKLERLLAKNEAPA